MSMRVLVFGDSVAYGAWDTQGGWVARLKREGHLQTVQSQGENKLQVINLGIGADTSTKILKRMEDEITARSAPEWPLVLVFAFGINDERSLNGVVETPIELFEKNVREIIKIAKQHSSKILFLGNSPMGKDVVLFKDKEYSDVRVKSYEEKLEKIVGDAELPFLPIRPVFEKAGLENLYSYDMLHPNDEGHKLVAEAVKKKLLELDFI